MTTTHFFAFDTIRVSRADYTWASMDWHHKVRFHTSHAAAMRVSGRVAVTQVRVATAEDKRAVRAAKAAEVAARAARVDAFMREWSAR